MTTATTERQQLLRAVALARSGVQLSPYRNWQGHEATDALSRAVDALAAHDNRMALTAGRVR
jgi:hypothetical protein